MAFYIFLLLLVLFGPFQSDAMTSPGELAGTGTGIVRNPAGILNSKNLGNAITRLSGPSAQASFRHGVGPPATGGSNSINPNSKDQQRNPKVVARGKRVNGEHSSHSDLHGIVAKIENYKHLVVILEQLLKEAGSEAIQQDKLNSDWIYYVLSRVSLWQLKRLWEMFGIKEDDPRKEAAELVEEHMEKVLEQLKATKESQEQFETLKGWLMRASKILIDCDMFRHWENFEPMGEIMQEERRKEAMKKLRNNEHLAKLEKKENVHAEGDKHKHKHPSEDEEEEKLSEDEAKLLHRNN